MIEWKQISLHDCEALCNCNSTKKPDLTIEYYRLCVTVQEIFYLNFENAISYNIFTLNIYIV